MKDNVNRAVIFVAGNSKSFHQGQCTPLTALIDRPFLQHVVESLVEREFKSIDFIVHHHASEIENHFEDGVRWGASFRYHLVMESSKPYKALKRLKLEDDGQVLLVHGDRLNPELWKESADRIQNQIDTIAFMSSENGNECDSENWTGAAWLTRSAIEQIDLTGDADTFFQSLSARKNHLETVLVAKPLEGSTFKQLIEAQRRVLNKEFPEMLRMNQSGEEGVWIGRNVCMHPAIEIIPPVYIGANCDIGAQVKLGPNVVLSEGSLLNPKCEVNDSLIMRDSLIGEGLAIDGCILDRHQLYHVEHDVAVSINDELLMGTTKLNLPGGAAIAALFTRSAAILTFLLFSPLFLLAAIAQKLRYGQAFTNLEAARLPFDGDLHSVRTFKKFRLRCKTGRSNFHHFICEFLPGLLNIIKGDIGWVGVTAVSKSELKKMPEDWRKTYSQCHTGLINESTVLYGQTGNREETLTAEVYYAVTVKTAWSRMRRIASYFASVILGPRATKSKKRDAGQGMFRHAMSLTETRQLKNG